MSEPTSEPQTPPPPRAPASRRLRLLRAVPGLLLRGVAPLLTLAAALLVLMIGTERGLRLLVAQAQVVAGAGLQIGAVEGRLLDGFSLRDVRYRGDDGTDIAIGQLRLRHAPLALLGRRFQLDTLEIDGLVVRPGAAEPDAPDRSDAPIELPTRLPIDLDLRSVELRDFRLLPPEVATIDPGNGDGKVDSSGDASDRPRADATPTLAIARTRLVAGWSGDRVTITALETSGLPETGPLALAGRARLAASQVDIEELVLTGPGRLALSGRLGLNAADSALDLQWQGLRWPAVPTDTSAAPLLAGFDGSATLLGRAEAYRFRIDGSGQLQDFAGRLHASGSGGMAALMLEALTLDVRPGAAAPRGSPPAGALRAGGTVAWAPELRASLDIALEHVNPGWFAADLPGDLNGTIKTTTTQRDDQPELRFVAELARSTFRGKPLTLAAEGVADRDRVTLDRLRLRAGGGDISADGALRWAPQLRADLRTRLDRVDPALLLPDWPGRLNGELLIDSRIDPTAGTPLHSLRAELRESRLRGYPLALEARAELAETDDGYRVAVEGARLRSGRTELTLHGAVTPPFAFDARIDSPDLSALLPELGGSIHARAAVQGPLENPTVTSDGQVRALSWAEDYRVAEADWQIDATPDRPDSRLELLLRDADLGIGVRRLRLVADGQEVYHRAALTVDTERGRAGLALVGGFDRRRGEWGGELAQLDLVPTGLPAWALAKPAGLLLGPQRRALERACLDGDAGRACFHYEQNVLADGARADWNIDRLLLSAFQPLLGDALTVTGRLDGDGSIDFTGGNLTAAQARLELHEAAVDLPDVPVYRFDTARLDAEQVDGELRGRLDLALAGAALNAAVQVAPGERFGDRALGGEITLRVPDLAFVEPLLPQLDALRGALDGQVRLGGTIDAPSTTGRLNLRDGEARLVAAGIDLRALTLNVETRDQAPLALDGSVRSGDGQLQIRGEVDPRALPLRADITVVGKDFQAMNTAEARAWIDADLRLLRDASGARLGGTIAVPRAEITPKGLGGDGAVAASADEVLIGVETPEREPPMPLSADLRLTLGQRVRIEGFGLKTRIEGQLAVSQQPGLDARGRGEFRLIDGRYQAYGQDLNIETGRLIFSGGPVTAPAVDLYATRQPREDIKVGVRVRGTLDQPEISLQSTPSLPREQQLSWLVLGRSLETSSTQDRSRVSSAALSLGLGGGDYLAGLIGKKVGLDELSVGAASVNNSEVAANAQSIGGAQASGAGVDAGAEAAQLTLGKYLTPRLFVSYGISLFQDGYTFRMFYTLGRGFKLATETGTASSGDLIYTTDRGKKSAPAAGR